MAGVMTVGFLGAGRMATALAEGFIGSGLYTPGRILASDPSPAARKHFAAATKARVTSDNLSLVKKSDVIVLAVKPDQVTALLEAVGPEIGTGKLVISIAAGVSLATLENELPPKRRVVRVMPNTPAIVGMSASAFAVGRHVRAADVKLTQRLFSAVGLAFEVKEALLDAVTGLSGSGPAYVCQFIEALSDGGVAAGLPRDIATKLAAQTVLGTAKMVLETGAHPGELKDRVTSPGGTTIEGLHELEKGGLRGTVMSAVRAASRKSRRLGRRQGREAARQSP